MKKISRTKKAAAVFMASLFTALASLTAVPASAAGASLSYSYSGVGQSLAGYAQGTITLTGASGTYQLYWANDNAALDGYYPIAKLTLSSDGSKTYSMPARTAIPVGATKLIAFKSSSEPSDKSVSSAAAVYSIPAEKRLSDTSDQLKYRFLSYSDVHFDSPHKTYVYDEIHWQKALETAVNRGVDFMVGSGDYVNNNIDYSQPSVEEWKKYQRIIANSDYCNPIYEAIGNHELWHSVSNGTRDFIKATGLSGSLSSSDKPYFEKTINGDHFIFMALEGGFYPNKTTEFSTAQLDWLENLLQTYNGDGNNIYVIEHALFDSYGAGDNPTHPYYDIPLDSTNASHIRLKNLMQTYKDCIFITGHTHIGFSEQYNFSDNNGTSAQMIHNSSVGGVRYVSGDSLTKNYTQDGTEGYIVDVYDDAIIFNGANLYYNRINPNWCYILRTSNQVHTNNPALEQDAPVQNDGTETSYYLKGSFNDWKATTPFYTTSDSNVISVTVQLSAGNYTFKINNGSTWYGNGGTIVDTTKATSNSGWEMTTSAGNCTLQASGGYYTFNFSLSNHKLNLLYSTTAPATVAPTTALSTTAAPIAQTTTSATASAYSPGDTNGDGTINISDATAIQLHLAYLRNLTPEGIIAADVSGNGTVDINDATMIQKYISSLITGFNVTPVQPTTEKPTTAEPTTEAGSPEKARLLAEISGNLSLYYRYSSYDCYQALKKAYRNSDYVNTATLRQLQNDLLSVVDVSNVD